MLTLAGRPYIPLTRTCLTINQPSPSIKNTGHLTQYFLVLRIVRGETLPGTAPCGQYMEALRANRGVHASGLSRTEAGIYPAPTPPRADLTHHHSTPRTQ